MRSAVLCHAFEDDAAAREIAGFLEINCPISVSVDEGRIGPGYDLIDAAERALSAEIALILLSPDSVPAQWIRPRWEPVLLEMPKDLRTEVVFLLLRSCKFPELLRRGTFFDLSSDLLAGQRAVKRWLLHGKRTARTEQTLSVNLERLRRRIADRPGAQSGLDAGTARTFFDVCQDEFEGAFWIDCAHRSPAGIVGDTAAALGLRLSGPIEQNIQDLRDFCAERRCLLVFDHIAPEDAELASYVGRTSVLITRFRTTHSRRSLEEIMALFSGWVRHRDECLRSLGETQAHLQKLVQEERWPAAMQLGSAMAVVLRNSDRLAEAREVLALLIQAGQAAGDEGSVRRFKWDESWILERWGAASAGDVIWEAGEQLAFGF